MHMERKYQIASFQELVKIGVWYLKGTNYIYQDHEDI